MTTRGRKPVSPEQQQADKLLEATAAQLKDLLARLAAQLDPFPYFYGSTEVRALEAEPPASAGSDKGCVVICQDGELYELVMKMESMDPLDETMLDRKDEIKGPLPLPPAEYIPYAYNAIRALTEALRTHRR